MSKVWCSFGLSSASTDFCFSAILNVSNADNSVSSSGGLRAGWSFRSPLLSAAAIVAKLGTNRQNMLHRTQAKLGSEFRR